MKFKLEVLASKPIAHRTWYLCRGNLLEYLNSLKKEFYEFAIQRRIVKNQYLDVLYETILSGDPLPIITLTYRKEITEKLTNGIGAIEIEMDEAEILDGLQRTFRLWAYKIVSEKYTANRGLSVTDLAKKIKADNHLFFETGVISTGLIKELISKSQMEEIPNAYDGYETYFVIWSGLKENEIIKKMLVLNAGQKAVSKTHQFELLFLHFYEEIIKTQKKIKLVKEKDVNSNEVKKGNREIGQFMFSSIIVALQSFVEQKPLRISTEGLFEELVAEVDTKQAVYDSVFSSDFIKLFLDQLFEIDKTIEEKENAQGKEWFVKDTSLSGVFAALGRRIKIDEKWSEKELAEFAGKGFNELKDAIITKGFNLKQFTEQYNNMSSRSVNIGNFIRKVIMEYTFELLDGREPTWSEIFEKSKPGGKL